MILSKQDCELFFSAFDAITDYANGKKEHTCSVCGAKETAKIPALKIPLTGDDGYLVWAALLVVSGGTAALIVLSRKRKHVR